MWVIVARVVGNNCLYNWTEDPKEAGKKNCTCKFVETFSAHMLFNILKLHWRKGNTWEWVIQEQTLTEALELPVCHPTAGSCKVIFVLLPLALVPPMLWRRTAPCSSWSPSLLLPAPLLVCCPGSRFFPHANLPGRCFPSGEVLCLATVPNKEIQSSPCQGRRESRGKGRAFPAAQGSAVQILPSFSLIPWPVISRCKEKERVCGAHRATSDYETWSF